MTIIFSGTAAVFLGMTLNSPLRSLGFLLFNPSLLRRWKSASPARTWAFMFAFLTPSSIRVYQCESVVRSRPKSKLRGSSHPRRMTD
jgi:hypothetical protein